MAKVWSLSEDVEPVLLEHQSPVTEVAVSEDGHAITLGDDNRVLTWHLQASIDKPRPEELATGISTCQLTADGRRVLTMGENGDVSLWRIDSGTLEFPTIRGKGSGVRGCVSPSGRRLLVADAGLTRVFDFATNPAYISEVRMGAAVVESETDGVQHLLAVSRDGAGHRIDLRNDLRANAFHHGSPIDTCTIPAVVTPAVATGSSDGLLNVWRGPEWELALCLRFEGAVRRVQCNVSATTFVVAVQDKVHIHSGVPGTDIIATLQHKANVNDVAIVGPDEDIVTACEDGSIYVWSGKSHNQIGSSSHESSVFRLGVADQTKYYVSASQEGVRVWDAETHKVTAGALKHDSALSFSECSKTGGYLVTCAIDGTARVWDSRTGEPRTPLLQHQGVTYAAFDWSGVRLATGSRDGIVRLWSCNGGEAVSPPLRHDSPVTHLAFDRMGETLSVACEDGTIRVWDVTPATDEADYLVSIAELWSGAKVDGEVLRELSDDDLHLRWAEIRDSTRKPTLQESLIDRHQEVAQQVFPYQMLTPEPEVRWHLREAATSVDEHRFGAALWHLDRAVSVDPATPGVLRRRAALHQRLGDPEAALADCTRAIEYHQEDASNWVRRARVFGELGDWKSAAKDFALVAKVDAWSANSRADYAFASLIAGDEVSYRRICRQAVDALCETTPQPPPGAIAWPPPAWSPRQNPRATYAIIRVSLLAPETEDFVIELEAWTAKLHELFPECEEHRFIRALALDRLDRFDEALTLLQARPKSDGRIEMPEVWLLLSILQYRLGVLDEGDAAFDKAIEVKRDTDIVDWLRRLQVEELFEEAKQVRLRIRGAE